MSRLSSTALFVIVLACAAPALRGGLVSYDATLSGPAESPPNASPGTGSAEVDYNNTGHTLHVHVTFSGLTSATTASHIHSPTPVPGAQTAGVATTVPFFAGFPIGVTSGFYDNTLDLTSSSSWNPAFITANGGSPATAETALATGLAAGEAYLNIHTTSFPGGEIRGFLEPVPEPATLAVFGAGVLLLARRQR